MEVASTYFCTRCRQDLPLSAFCPSQVKKAGSWCRSCSNEHRRDKRNGVTPERDTDVCLWCGNDIRHLRSHARWCSGSCAARGWRRNNPDGQRRNLLRSVYGISPDQFDAMLNSQDNRCAICKSTEPSGIYWHIDHNHATNTVRGILCAPCNSGLGSFRDDPERLIAAINYLRMHSAVLDQVDADAAPER